MMSKHKKQLSAVAAAALTVAVALTGTYAWQSDQPEWRKTRWPSEGNPGGRLHDDFNGSSKAVYVENFTAPEEGGLDLFIRVRLDEYLEIGEDAGKNLRSAAKGGTVGRGNRHRRRNHLGHPYPEQCGRPLPYLLAMEFWRLHGIHADV